jgi:hypothetical protein
MVLGGPQVQNHQLIALTGVLDSALVGGFDAHQAVLPAGTRRPRFRSGPDVNITSPINAIDDQIGHPQDRMIVGYRYYLH